MTIESGSEKFGSWQVDELLVKQTGLRLIPSASGIVLTGRLEVNAQYADKAHIDDGYQIVLRVPQNFPKEIPSVFETGGRIPPSYHKLRDGSLCLGSETRLRLLIATTPSLLGFVERCLVPYLYRYSYLEAYGIAPFEDLAHGLSGIRQDLTLLFGLPSESSVLPFVRLTTMKKRYANKRECPCGSGRRLGRCHNRSVNLLRYHLGRYWFRVLERQLLS